MEKELAQTLSRLIETFERIDNRLKRLEELEAQGREPKPPQNRLIPLVKWNAYHPWPTIDALESLRFMVSLKSFKIFLKNT